MTQKNNSAWKANFSVQLFKPEMAGTMGCSQVTFNKCSKNQIVYGTSDEGELFSFDWGNKQPDEAGRVNILTGLHSSERNGRPTVAIDSSPFYDDLILTVHDCHFCIWKTECEEPVFVSPFIITLSEKTNISCGFFSPSRQGVIYIGRADGNIDVWDFMDQSNSPTQQHFVVASGISSMEINTHEKENDSLAVGDSEGCLHLLKLPLNLRRQSPGEQEIIANFFVKEMERVLYFKDRFFQREQTRLAEEQLLKDQEDDDFKFMRRDDSENKKTKEQIIEDNYQQFVKEFYGLDKNNSSQQSGEQSND